MKRIVAWILAAATCCSAAWASEAGPGWERFPKERLTDLGALQNGAKLFVNYCLNCHSASYMRYNRLKDIGLSDAQVKDNLLFTAEKALKDHGDKVSAEDRQNIDRGISELKEALKGDDLAAINKAKEALLKASHKLAEEMYKNAAPQNGNGAGPEGAEPHNAADQGAGPAKGDKAGGKDDVVDADFKEV
jgi:cytochrome c1